MNDRDLLAPLRRGDHEAFDALFRAYYPPLVGVAESILRRRALAEEVTQDVFLELWRRHESLVVTESLRSYLFRAVRNRALNHLRHERVELSGPAGDAAVLSTPATAPATLEEEEIEAALREAVATLPDRCRAVFELSRVHGLRHAEIAEVLGISVKTVEVQITRALRVVRASLAPWLTEHQP